MLKKRLHKREKSETEEDKEKMMNRTDNFRRIRVISTDKRYDSSNTSEFSPVKAIEVEAFNGEARKLIPPCETE